jgi:hypothetical protein
MVVTNAGEGDARRSFLWKESKTACGHRPEFGESRHEHFQSSRHRTHLQDHHSSECALVDETEVQPSFDAVRDRLVETLKR